MDDQPLLNNPDKLIQRLKRLENEIQDIKKDIHTIRGKKILYLTKTKLLQGDKLVKIEKDSLFF